MDVRTEHRPGVAERSESSREAEKNGKINRERSPERRKDMAGTEIINNEKDRMSPQTHSHIYIYIRYIYRST